jgi:hypothetical protein
VVGHRLLGQDDCKPPERNLITSPEASPPSYSLATSAKLLSPTAMSTTSSRSLVNSSGAKSAGLRVLDARPLAHARQLEGAGYMAIQPNVGGTYASALRIVSSSSAGSVPRSSHRSETPRPPDGRG